MVRTKRRARGKGHLYSDLGGMFDLWPSWPIRPCGSVSADLGQVLAA
jgi:hypothetical protein